MTTVWDIANRLEQESINSQVVESNYKVHEMVTIYKDPLTETNPEGKACLLHLVNSDAGDGLEHWNVCFEGDDGAAYSRLIKKH